MYVDKIRVSQRFKGYQMLQYIEICTGQQSNMIDDIKNFDDLITILVKIGR